MTEQDSTPDALDQNRDGTITLKEKVSFRRRIWSGTPVKVRRAIVAVVGGTLVLLGVALVVLPDPFTMPLVLAGFVVLASEFAWAEHVLLRGREKMRSAMKAVRRRPKS
jgi:hypothetical protein